MLVIKVTDGNERADMGHSTVIVHFASLIGLNYIIYALWNVLQNVSVCLSCATFLHTVLMVKATN